MTWLLRINRALIIFFAFSSGVFKIAGAITNRGDPAAWWESDNHLFAHMGLSVAMVGTFGVIQALGGLGLLFQRILRPAAWLVAACNLFATTGLFVGGVQPFGAISLLFVAMALLVLYRPRAATGAVPAPG